MELSDEHKRFVHDDGATTYVSFKSHESGNWVEISHRTTRKVSHFVRVYTTTTSLAEFFATDEGYDAVRREGDHVLQVRDYILNEGANK